MKQRVMAAALLAAAWMSAGAQPKAKAAELQGRIDPEQQVGMERAKVGEPGALYTVYFDHQSPLLTAETKVVLEEAAAKLSSGSQPIELAGHTSGVGDGGADQKLSELRANAVKNFLMKHGITGERLKASGYGKTRPADTNETEAGREHNRRVVITAAAG